MYFFFLMIAKLWDLRHCMAAGDQKIFHCTGLRQLEASIFCGPRYGLWSFFTKIFRFRTSSASWSFWSESGWCRDMNRTFMLIMLAGTFFRQFPRYFWSRVPIWNTNPPGISELAGDPGLWYLFGCCSWIPQCYTKVDMKFGPVIKYCRLCFCPAVSWRILKERFPAEGIGNLIIILGILVYTLWS